MNDHQMAQQLRKLLQEAVWPGAGGEVVFGTQVESVVVSAGDVRKEMMPQTFPSALIMLGDTDPDEDHPDLVEATFRVVVGAQSFGSRLGEEAIIGGPTTDLLSSDNRGVAEVMERALNAIGDLTGMDGCQIQVVSSARGGPRPVGAMEHVAFAEARLRALCTQDRHFIEPTHLARSGTTWTWEGSHCVARYDFYQFRLMYRSTSYGSPGTSPSDAGMTEAGTSSSAETLEHTVQAGNYYSIFADYDDRGADSAADSSAGDLPGTYVTE